MNPPRGSVGAATPHLHQIRSSRSNRCDADKFNCISWISNKIRASASHHHVEAFTCGSFPPHTYGAFILAKSKIGAIQEDCLTGFAQLSHHHSPGFAPLSTDTLSRKFTLRLEPGISSRMANQDNILLTLSRLLPPTHRNVQLGRCPTRTNSKLDISVGKGREGEG